MKDTNRIWFLMAKKLSSSITSAEAQELEQLLASDPELWYSYELLEAVMNLEDVPEAFIKEIESLLDKQTEPQILNNLLLEQLNDGQLDRSALSASKFKKYSLYASALTFFVLLTWFGILVFTSGGQHKRSLSAMNEIIAPKGSKTQITLSDGTSIWLNAGSKLIYPKNFNLENREVYLIGEAYFKVVHHAKHSFTVHAPEADIYDLGTTFNVKAYAGSPTTETTLIEGSVEVVLKDNPDQKILIQPNEKLILHNKQLYRPDSKKIVADPIYEVFKLVPFSKTNEIVETAWVSNKLIFRNARFEDLAREMERRYNVSIAVRNDEVKDYQLTGIFTNESIEEAMQLLQAIAPFKYKISNGEIVIDK